MCCASDVALDMLSGVSEMTRGDSWGRSGTICCSIWSTVLVEPVSELLGLMGRVKYNSEGVLRIKKPRRPRIERADEFAGEGVGEDMIERCGWGSVYQRLRERKVTRTTGSAELQNI